jgi:small-conductance mechanosensitive channel
VDLWAVVRRTWDFLTNRIGDSNFTPIGILAGILILVLTLFLSRRIGRILERRIAKRSYIDPGLRYTIARLASYLLIVIGIVAALQTVGVNMTSIAVLFTALSVGIGFGLQYIAAFSSNGQSASVIASLLARMRATLRALTCVRRW